MKSKVELKEFRDLDSVALKEKRNTLEGELLNLRFRQASGQLQHGAELGKLRRRIAQVNTVLAEQTRSSQAQA